MARCRFTPLAKQDLKEINRFIACDHPDNDDRQQQTTVKIYSIDHEEYWLRANGLKQLTRKAQML